MQWGSSEQGPANWDNEGHLASLLPLMILHTLLSVGGQGSSGLMAGGGRWARHDVSGSLCWALSLKRTKRSSRCVGTRQYQVWGHPSGDERGGRGRALRVDGGRSRGPGVNTFWGEGPWRESCGGGMRQTLTPPMAVRWEVAR